MATGVDPHLLKAEIADLPDLKDLVLFHAYYRLLRKGTTASAAANKLGTDPSQLSRMLRRLEQWLRPQQPQEQKKKPKNRKTENPQEQMSLRLVERLPGVGSSLTTEADRVYEVIDHFLGFSTDFKRCV